ncbi:MAG: hypothetical protein MRZ39_08490 [Oscillospiraceae bacterium]|nr:hypothetical protein [Oscillospiraceae bacterium]
MNFKKIIASVAAAAVAVSAMAVSAFALTTETHRTDATLYVISEKPDQEKPSWITNSGYTIEDVYGVTYHVEFKAEEVADPATWIGGGMGANSNSTGWKQIEWGRADKEVVADLENGTITWLSTTPVFKTSDKYAQFWLQTWGGTVTVKSIDVLGKDGVVLSDETPDPVDEPAEEAAPADEATTEAADATAADDADEALDETADEDVVADDADAADEDVVADDTADEDVVVTDDAADEAVVDAPAADADTAAAATGNTSAAVIFSVMAVAGAAAIVAKKRK